MQNSAVLSIAFRYVSPFEVRGEQKKRIRLRSSKVFVAVAGLAIGVAVLIIVLSIVNGFERELRERILSVVPHAVLYHREGIDDWQAIAEKLKHPPANRFSPPLAVAPMNNFQALLINEDNLATTAVSGIVPAAEKKVSIIDSLFISGSLDALDAQPFSIVLASQLAEKLQVGVGDKVKLLMPEARISLLGVLPRYRQFEVVGIFEVGASLDQQLSYIPLDAAGRLNRSRQPVSTLRLKMPDIFDASYDAWEIAEFLNAELEAAQQPHYWYVTDWTKSHGSLYQIISMTKSMLGLLVLLIVMVACFNLSSSLIMLVNEKRGDIAILMSQGMSARQIMSVFVLQALLSALAGLLIGILVASVLLAYIGQMVEGIEKVFMIDLTSSYPVHYLPTEMLLVDVIVIALAVFSLSFLASVYPALQATRIKPADELRHD